LNLTRISLIALLVFVITSSFAAQIQKEKNGSFTTGAFNKSPASAMSNQAPYDLLTFPSLAHYVPVFSVPSFTVGGNESALSLFGNSTRTEICNFITANPGVQFRGICMGLGLAIGTAEFHLGVLKKAGLISFVRDGRYKRYFETKKYSSKEMEMISLLRHETVGNILKNMLKQKTVSHGEMASQLSITSQGLTWHMNQLKKTGVVKKSRDGMRVFYSLEKAHIPVLTESISILGQC
jgi:predicted transcriptional regulator